MPENKNTTVDYVVALLDKNGTAISKEHAEFALTADEYLPLAAGQRLAMARRAAGLTQVEAAQATGISNKTISYWERGHREIPLQGAYKLLSLYNKICYKPDGLTFSLDEISGLDAAAGLHQWIRRKEQHEGDNHDI